MNYSRISPRALGRSLWPTLSHREDAFLEAKEVRRTVFTDLTTPHLMEDLALPSV